MAELRNAENESLVPSESGSSPPCERMEQLGVGAEQPAAEFDFELGEVLTIEEATRRCTERRVDNVPALVSLSAMLFTTGQGVYSTLTLP